ncbi:unnamed protein product [Bursaphelenchus xylophilus]|uniref:(pine wood nematode) hypothetical protein n=1 Tax=Bursaphelenchus xylophilus TaxID=6326 RepID=A0A1I7S5Z9_BURXY|nr:unnamed protein product [Bursaphelenchus xylophilus]CAG9082454.1 unnamed protein product [Bursaphelenchus xylophilus]
MIVYSVIPAAFLAALCLAAPAPQGAPPSASASVSVGPNGLNATASATFFEATLVIVAPQSWVDSYRQIPEPGRVCFFNLTSDPSNFQSLSNPDDDNQVQNLIAQRCPQGADQIKSFLDTVNSTVAQVPQSLKRLFENFATSVQGFSSQSPGASGAPGTPGLPSSGSLPSIPSPPNAPNAPNAPSPPSPPSPPSGSANLPRASGLSPPSGFPSGSSHPSGPVPTLNSPSGFPSSSGASNLPSASGISPPSGFQSSGEGSAAAEKAKEAVTTLVSGFHGLSNADKQKISQLFPKLSPFISGPNAEDFQSDLSTLLKVTEEDPSEPDHNEELLSALQSFKTSFQAVIKEFVTQNKQYLDEAGQLVGQDFVNTIKTGKGFGGILGKKHGQVPDDIDSFGNPAPSPSSGFPSGNLPSGNINIPSGVSSPPSGFPNSGSAPNAPSASVQGQISQNGASVSGSVHQ